MAQPVGMEGVTVTNPPYPPQESAPPSYYPQVAVTTNPDPQPMTIERQGSEVQDNLTISIISIFFCFILGIIATIRAQESKDNVLRGDIARAQENSLMARKLAIAAIICGCVVLGLIIFFYVFLPIIGVTVLVASY